MNAVLVPTVAEYARMPWAARAELMRRLDHLEAENMAARRRIQQRRAAAAGGRRSRPVLSAAQVRVDAQRQLDVLPAEPDDVVAARRHLLLTEYGGVR